VKMQRDPASTARSAALHRGLGIWQATALNVANMVGIGPFITIHLVLSAMGGPQALVAWIIAAALVVCDGLVWSELGAALPGSGGSYHFLARVFGQSRFGRLLPFLFIWQFLVTGTLEMASGYIGAVNYLKSPFPQLNTYLDESGHTAGGLAAIASLLVTLALCRNIRIVGRTALVLCAGTITTVLFVIASGLLNFHADLITLPEHAFRVDGAFLHGLGGAMAIGVYDYLGYYNVCHLGDEVVDPARTIPRSVMLSIGGVAVMYLTMNLAIIGVVPWQRAMQSEAVASEFIAQLYGRGAAQVFAVLILWTVLAGTFSMLLGYSRIPYAAAANGGFFRAFARVDEVRRFPTLSLGFLGLLTAVFCFFPLRLVIEAAVIVRIAVQFIVQIIALHVFRGTQPNVTLPFRMWLYPLPSLIALAGWIFLVATADRVILWTSAAVIGSGCLAFAAWSFSAILGEAPPHEVMSGRRCGALAGAARFVLSAVARIYGQYIDVRNSTFDHGWKRTFHAAVPVVSIGNLTTGGTGKTPVAAFLAGWFLERGVRACFVSRGYGAAANGPNDEALVLGALCPDVPHLQNPDRVAAARLAVETHASQLVILDDGFQHRRLARDLDVVLVDATNPWGYGYLLPRGLLREPILSLRRAGLILITRVDRASREAIDEIRRTIVGVNPHCGVAEISFPPTRFINSQGLAASLESLRGASIAAFCGIGNPAAFHATLVALGCHVVSFREFPDHHNYSSTDIDDLQRWAGELSVDAVVCTQKDLVKLAHESLGARPLWAVKIGVKIAAGEHLIAERLANVIPKPKLL
jgi:tetraacyldisaccharide 4'-kinase